VSRAPKPKKHQRLVRFSVAVPATVEMLVGTDDDEPSEDSDWEILSVLSVRCEATPRVVEENMHDTDFEALAALAASAKDQ
jgi:uncharacterized protein (UPF0276 family)